MRKIVSVFGALLTVGLMSCGDVNRKGLPVDLFVTTTSQPIQRFDLFGGNGCSTASTFVVLEIQSRLLDTTVTNTSFLDIRLNSYRVTYARTDGGHQVPAPYVRSLDVLIPTGGSSNTVVFHITDFQQIFTQAPFPALLPQNGGRDPETGLAVVKMNITLEIFGETLAGDRVSASTTFPLDVCYNCGGCQP